MTWPSNALYHPFVVFLSETIVPNAAWSIKMVQKYRIKSLKPLVLLLCAFCMEVFLNGLYHQIIRWLMVGVLLFYKNKFFFWFASLRLFLMCSYNFLVFWYLYHIKYWNEKSVQSLQLFKNINKADDYKARDFF